VRQLQSKKAVMKFRSFIVMVVRISRANHNFSKDFNMRLKGSSINQNIQATAQMLCRENKMIEKASNPYSHI
jgi:hypothetical protein